MITSETITPSSLETLKAMVGGDVCVPGDGGYDETRRTWNLAVDQPPAAVVYAESAVDVGGAVRFARLQGMQVTPQATGHGAGPLERLEGAMLLKQAFAPWHAGYDYYNFVKTPAEGEVVLPPASYERLQKIKATYAPDQTISSAHPVRPAAQGDAGPTNRKVDR